MCHWGSLSINKLGLPTHFPQIIALKSVLKIILILIRVLRLLLED